MFSSFEHPNIVQGYVSEQLKLGRMLGSLDLICHSTVHINRFSVIPKGYATGKWCLITDLSYPPGESVNDGIDPELCSLRYTSVDDEATAAAGLGQGALMSKVAIDALMSKVAIEAAYRLVPVHPMIAHFWAWNGRARFSQIFGIRSAPKIFNAVANAVEWYLKLQGDRALISLFG